jgi:AcrR family transcriptional regulator
MKISMGTAAVKLTSVTVNTASKAGTQASKSELKRIAILDSAARILRRRGYAQTTLEEIARDAGTQAGSLYYYFESKDALIEEVLAQSTKRLSARVYAELEQLGEDAPVLDRLLAVIKTHTLTVLERDDYALAYQKAHDQISDEMRDHIAEAAARRYARFWHKLIEEEIRAGVLRKDFEPRLLRLLLIGSISWMADWYNPKGASSPETIAATIARLFLEGAGTSATRKSNATNPGASTRKGRAKGNLAAQR